MRENSAQLLRRAEKVIPGGVNSPVRAYRAVGGGPPFLVRAEGAHVFDVDGNRYLDFVGTWGPAILGHAQPEVVRAAQDAVARGSSFGAPTEAEIELAEEIIQRVPGVEQVRLVCSGTEAGMSAIRLARGATGRDRILKFTGCYHGHADSFLIAAGSGALTLGTPDSPGVTRGTAQDTLLARFNDLDSVRKVLESHRDQVAAVILEPICGNTGCIPPQPGFLEGLQTLCLEHGTLLIFDEVMTGFRVARGGAAERYDITPDLFCFGKVIGGGFPLAAYGGRRDLMSQIAPAGPIYQAGTLSGNPVAVQAGLATLRQLNTAAYEQLEARGEQLEQGLNAMREQHGWPLSVNRVGSLFTLFFTPGPVHRHEDVADIDPQPFQKYFHAMLEAGIYLAPSPFEAAFLSTAHTEEDIAEYLEKTERALGAALGGGGN